MSTAEAGPAASAPPGSTRRSLGANVSALAASQAITWVLTLLWTLVVPRMLGPAGMGLMVTAMSVTSILGLVLGLPTRDFMTREVVARPMGGPALLGSAILFRLAMAPLFFAAVAVYASFADLGTVGVTVLYLATASMLLSLLTEPALSAFQAVERMEYLAYYEVLNKTFSSLGGITLALLGVKVVGLSLFGLVVAAGSAVVGLRWLRGLVGIDLRPGLRRIGSTVRDSVPYWTFGVFFMIYLWIDSVMLGLMVSPEEVGYYGVATKLFTTLMFVPVIIATASLPRLVSAFEQGWERLGAVARAPVEIVVILGLPACVGAAMTAGDLIPLLYGRTFAGAAPVLVVLSFCLPLMYLNIMLNQVLVAARRPLVWSALMLGATIVNPAVNFALIRFADRRWDNGAIGAGISLLVTELLITLVAIGIVGRRILSTATVGRLTRAGLAAGAMAGAMRALAPFGVVPAAVGGCVVFGGAALLLRVLSAEERDLLASVSRRMLRRLGPRRAADARRPDLDLRS